MIGAGVAQSDAILLGRRTYLTFAELWPKQGSDVPMADYMNNTPKHIVSSNLDTIEWANSSLVTGDLAEKSRNSRSSPAGTSRFPPAPGWCGRVPAFVCLRHPPIPVGIPLLDSMPLLDGDALGEVVAGHPHVDRVLAGHLHRVVSAAFAHSTLTIAPSTYRQSELCMRADRQIGYLPEPTGFLLHLLTDAGCITHTVPVSHVAALIGDF